MRINMPVSTVEHQLGEHEVIVSQTDLKGKITYANPGFIRISGYSNEELLGSPHNLVRHPDMPPEAFADMWQNLLRGVPWDGIVKNRCKNGDFYWVKANVTPIRENGRVTGFMSVRTRPSRAQIEAAEAAYRLFRNGQAQGMQIKNGQVVAAGWRGKWHALRNMPLETHLRWKMVLLLTLALIPGIEAITLSKYWMLALSVTSIFIIFSTWRSMQSAMIKPMAQALDFARTIASGDLTADISSQRHDEIGQLLRALNQMNVNLIAAVGDVRVSINHISANSAVLATENMDLSARTEAQASSLEETAASMEEFSSTVKQNAASAEEANNQARYAAQIAGKGGSVVNQVGETMAEISTSAHKIVDIISLIDGIAFQTNILALNAAVEAARAGEQGRGFAVVAGEVRSLAQRSAAAAKEIKHLIADSNEKVTHGNQLVVQATSTMQEIVQAIENVTAIMAEISNASREQSQGVDQVNQAIAQMDEVTQSNASQVEQAADIANNLNQEAQQLHAAVGIFKLKGRL